MGACSPRQAKKSRQYDDWEVKDATSTLQRADEIRGNSTLHGAVQKHAKKQMRSLKKIASTKPMSASKR